MQQRVQGQLHGEEGASFLLAGATGGFLTWNGCCLASELIDYGRKSEDMESRWDRKANVQDRTVSVVPGNTGDVFLERGGKSESILFSLHSPRLVHLRIRKPGPEHRPGPSAQHSLSLLWLCPYFLPGPGPPPARPPTPSSPEPTAEDPAFQQNPDVSFQYTHKSWITCGHTHTRATS